MDLFTTPIEQIVTSIDWKLMFSIIQGALAFFIVLWLKNLIVGFFAWLKFKNSMHICLGTWIRLPTSSSYVDGQIQSADMRFIEVNTKETRIYIPTKTFPDRDWVIVKKDALLSHEDDMKNIGPLHDTNVSPMPLQKKEN
ncbi:MAG: mechanosensitive ion channel [Candidatus Magnetomorum sp.]|nr:mechanosensitive ion channel [Candidatus Magnetomorum sp.]